MVHRSFRMLCLLLAATFAATAHAITFEARVSSDDDDAEEFADGWINRGSSDLEMTFESSQQTVGIRFKDVKIPAGTFVTNAWVQFEVDEPTTGPTFLTLFGEYTGEAKKFERKRYNISQRPRTVAAVDWAPAPWPERQISSVAQRTPNLAAIVQEIIGHPDWDGGSDLALIITGTGKRVAESHDGRKSGAALLHVEFSNTDPGLPPLDSWSALELRFDSHSVAVDTVSGRLLLPVADVYTQLSPLAAQVDFALADEGYTLGFDFAAPINSGTVVDFGEREFGSAITVQLYQNGQFVETQLLVLTSLPVLELTAANIVDEPKLPGTFRLSTADIALNLPTQAMGIEFRGSTSQAFDKKSFGLELVENDDPSEEINVPLLGLRDDGDWILDAAYRDTSFVRNIVSHDIYNDMRPFAFINESGEQKGQATIRGTQVEVLINESYHGVYVLSERVDRKLLKLKKIDVPEDADGNDLWDQVDFSDPDNGSALYKADTNSASLYFPNTVRTDFEQDYPDEDDIVHWQPLEDLIEFVTNSSDAEFIAGVDEQVDLDSVVDYWLLTNLTMNRDTLKKNYFLAKSGSGKWFFVPWDYDATFDMWWTGRIYGTTSWWDPGKNNLIRRLSELTATGFNTRVKARWNVLRGSLFTQAALTARFTQYHAATAPVPGQVENPRQRNFLRWPDSGGEGSTTPELGTVAYINDWLGRRLAFLDARIAAQAE